MCSIVPDGLITVWLIVVGGCEAQSCGHWLLGTGQKWIRPDFPGLYGMVRVALGRFILRANLNTVVFFYTCSVRP